LINTGNGFAANVRPKGYMRLFGINRIQFSEMASNGLIPGVKKADW
jgi:small subunit ribosomal protein S14